MAGLARLLGLGPASPLKATPEAVPPAGASPAAPPVGAQQRETVPTTTYGRPVVDIEEMHTRRPTGPVGYAHKYVRPGTIEEEMKDMTREHGFAFDKPAIENRFNLRARIPQNIANAKRKIEDWEKEENELGDLLKYDEYMRSNFNLSQNSRKVDRRLQNAALRGARAARAAEEKWAAYQEELTAGPLDSRQHRCRPEPEEEEEDYDEERYRPRRRTAANAIFVE